MRSLTRRPAGRPDSTRTRITGVPVTMISVEVDILLKLRAGLQYSDTGSTQAEKNLKECHWNNRNGNMRIMNEIPLESVSGVLCPEIAV